MAEARQIEIGAKLTIEAMQHVQVEFRRNPVSVVIGCQQGRPIFHHVQTQQQRIASL
jgi:hypothetical protein